MSNQPIIAKNHEIKYVGMVNYHGKNYLKFDYQDYTELYVSFIGHVTKGLPLVITETVKKEYLNNIKRSLSRNAIIWEIETNIDFDEDVLNQIIEQELKVLIQ